MTTRSTSRPRARCAFTLVELLVVVAVIVLVIALLLVAIAAAHSAAGRAGDTSALRQLAAAHAAYSADHNQRLLPGYVNADVQTDQLNLRAIEIDADTVVGAQAAASYVWRLASYVDGDWLSFHRLADPATRARLRAKFDDGDLNEIALQPSYGLNSIFIGGNSDDGGSNVTARCPWNTLGNEPIAATRTTSLRNPAQLVLFAPSVLHGASPLATSANDAWHELRAPYLKDLQWSIGAGGKLVPDDDAAIPAGLPRLGKGDTAIAVGFCDGSAATMHLEDLGKDMRRWAPFADGADWRVP